VRERKALVTLAVGDAFRRRWLDVCSANWRRYADRHGYDLICLDAPLDDSERAHRRSPAWQKCLILGQPFSLRYDRLVWVDLDILIHPFAPDICDGVPIDRIGAVDEYSIPTPELHRQMLAKCYAAWKDQGVAFVPNATPQEYYTVFGFERGFEQVVQTGAMVLSPAYHRDLLESVYHRYDDKGPGWNYEMRPLSYEILQAGCAHWIDPRFNYIWGIYEALHFPFLTPGSQHPRLAACLDDARQETYFLHFAGRTDLMAAAAAREPAAHPRCSATSPTPPRTPAALSTPRRPPVTSTPVALFLFNRPRRTATVFDAIRKARPTTLLLIADGPRPGHPEDFDDCAAARDVVAQVDWPCEVKTNFADANQGLKRRFDSGMQWVFAECEEAILLEDDCVPELSFFRFCDESLDRYRDDERILSISGNNFQFGQPRGDASYYFSRHPHIWGWATWRRAWSHYDPTMSEWPTARDEGWLESIVDGQHAVQYWSYIFEANHRSLENWDYAWSFSCWRRGGMHVLPNVNLVSNHGFGEDSSHTKNTNSKFAFLLTQPMAFPLQHPTTVAVDENADAFTEEVLYSGALKQIFARVRGRRLRPRSAAP
jgi:hypothetical protein